MAPNATEERSSVSPAKDQASGASGSGAASGAASSPAAAERRPRNDEPSPTASASGIDSGSASDPTAAEHRPDTPAKTQPDSPRNDEPSPSPSASGIDSSSASSPGEPSTSTKKEEHQASMTRLPKSVAAPGSHSDSV